MNPRDSRFQFDCPACTARLDVTAPQRGCVTKCRRCGIEMPTPIFPTYDPTDRPAAPVYMYQCHCAHCSRRIAVTEDEVGCPVECGDCGLNFPQPPPRWRRWYRPVARVFSRQDQQSSLHHLMLSADRVWIPDARIEPRARRRFNFFCGDCGSIQTARVWEIAAQQRCSRCEALMIVPAPRPVPVRHHDATRAPVAPVSGAGLFCPLCGERIRNADRTRQSQSRCRRCEVWF